MGGVKEQAERVLEDLKTERDHLAVKMHLAKAEIRDEWETLEKKWDNLRARTAQLSEAIGDAGEEVGDDLKIAGEDLKEGYRRLKSLMS